MIIQLARERAACMAAQRGMCLFLRGGSVYGMYPTGQTVRICGSRRVHDVWDIACETLLREQEDVRQANPAYRLIAPSGFYTSKSLWTLVWHVLTGKFNHVS